MSTKTFNPKVREKSIEERLRDHVKQLGGRAYKFTSPGHDGVPDRIILLPGGRMLFAELKAPGKTPTPTQRQEIAYLRGLGFRVEVIDSKEGVDELIGALRTEQIAAARRGKSRLPDFINFVLTQPEYDEMYKAFLGTFGVNEPAANIGAEGRRAAEVIFDEMAAHGTACRPKGAAE